MHASSLENMQKCYTRYVITHEWNKKEKIDVIDIGGANVNGSYADVFSEKPFHYRAADISEGADVDIVLENPYNLPFADNSVDILISGQAFEHVEYFWLLFEEMIRVLDNNGLLILIAPSSGPIHRYPVDCYRFYPDAYFALAKYTNCHPIYVYHDNRGPWNDLVGVFSKQYIKPYELSDISPTEWPKNRIEKQISPTIQHLKSTKPEYEQMKGKTPYLETLFRLHQVVSPKLYCEIGVRMGSSFNLSQCQSIGIDPMPEVELTEAHQQLFKMTSDNYFEFIAPVALKPLSIDLAFIDGMHLFEFVLRDFINIERYSHGKTVVVIDDVLPNHSEQASRVRQTAAWTGDIWKLVVCLRTSRPDLTLTLMDTYPTGLLVITGLKNKNNVLLNQYNPIVRRYQSMELIDANLVDVVERTDSIDPRDEDFWSGLEKLTNRKN